MGCINETLTEGFVARAPVLAMASTGTWFMAFTIGVQPSRLEDGQWVKGRSSYVGVYLFGEAAKNSFDSIRKGRHVLVVGRLKTFRTGEGKAAQYRTVVVARRVRYLDRKIPNEGIPPADETEADIDSIATQALAGGAGGKDKRDSKRKKKGPVLIHRRLPPASAQCGDDTPDTFSDDDPPTDFLPEDDLDLSDEAASECSDGETD